MIKNSFLLVAVLATVSSALRAETVTVRDTHLCCGGCATGAEGALADVKGVTDAAADVNAKVVSFEADDMEAAERGLRALADAGFYGTAAYGKKKIAYPTPKIPKGAKSNAFVLGGLHLCCGACVTATQKALADVKGVAVIDIDRNEETIKISGDGVLIQDAIKALHRAGFYGSPVTKKKPAPKK